MDSYIEDILVECKKSTALFAKTFFPETFDAPFSTLHDQIFELLDSDARKIVIAAPRGIGKTTIARTLAAKAIGYRDKRFICYVSNSATSAEMQTENIKAELLFDQDVRDIFGNIKASPYKDTSDMFSKKAWIASGYTMVLPRGSGQQVRGLNWIRYRPDLIIIDDLEDTETIENEDQRNKRKQWFFADLMKAVPKLHKNWRIIYIDTVKHEGALIEELLNADDWESLRLSICDENYKTLAPDFTSQEELDEELRSHRKKKIMDVFAREFMSIPISVEAASFRKEYFKYYNEVDKDFVERKRYLQGVVIVDPAKTTQMNNAQSGIVVWGIDPETQKMHMREARGEFYYPDQLYHDAFATCLRYGIRTLAVEVTGLEEFIKHPLTNEMHRLGYNFELVWLKARKGQGEFTGVQGGKKGRISSLISYYRQGLVYHNENSCGPLELQLLGFPRSKRWDVMDAAAYIVELMEMSLSYFMPNKYDDDPEEEYRELEKMHREDGMKDIDWDLYNQCPGIYDEYDSVGML